MMMDSISVKKLPVWLIKLLAPHVREKLITVKQKQKKNSDNDNNVNNNKNKNKNVT